MTFHCIGVVVEHDTKILQGQRKCCTPAHAWCQLHQTLVVSSSSPAFENFSHNFSHNFSSSQIMFSSLPVVALYGADFYIMVKLIHVHKKKEIIPWAL